MLEAKLLTKAVQEFHDLNCGHPLVPLRRWANTGHRPADRVPRQLLDKRLMPTFSPELLVHGTQSRKPGFNGAATIKAWHLVLRLNHDHYGRGSEGLEHAKVDIVEEVRNKELNRLLLCQA